jgi:hypothetical protein
VVGLLLLLGLFWYWASSLIGDDDENPSATPSQAAIVVTQAAPTETPTEEAAITPEETTQAGGGNEDTGDTGDTGAGTDAEATTPPEDENTAGGGATDGAFAEGDIVTVTDNDVNLRADPSTSGDVVETMTQGTELRITGASEEADEYTWWPVEDEATGNVGWVVEDFIEAS